MMSMPLGKRKYTTGRGRTIRGRVSKAPYASRAKKARMSGRTGYANILRVSRQVRALTRTIETKEGTFAVRSLNLPHNNVLVLNDTDGNVLNPFRSTNGTGDPMNSNQAQHIGDSINVRGLLIKFFVEAALQRSKVYFRFMLIKCAKGDTIDRSTLFKSCATNKMIDQINTERFTIVAQKTFNVSSPNTVASATSAVSGVPVSATVAGITGNRIFTMYIPGRKFGRSGVVQYENASSSQVKFYDYRLAVVAYDWFGTPQDLNTVGFINEGYCKLYFKDA